MVRHLTSKIAITIYVLVALGLGVWGFTVFKDRDGKIAATHKTSTDTNTTAPSSQSTTADTQNNQDVNAPADNNTTNPNGDSTVPNSTQYPAPVDNSKNPISSTPNVSGPMLANITPEHCDTGCRAFAADLTLFEYCQQSCGISPVKNVSSCDDKKDIQKDYCQKDLAINKEDLSLCDKIKDANIQQACKSRIEQDIEENQRRNSLPNTNSAPQY